VRGLSRDTLYSSQSGLVYFVAAPTKSQVFLLLKEATMKIKEENYVTIQGWMRTQLNLSGNELLVYAIIYGFSQSETHKFKGSLQYLADWCGATKQGILINLKSLIQKGYIEKTESEKYGIKVCEYTCINPVKDISPVLNKVEQGIKESLINNIVDKKDIQSISKDINCNNQQHPSFLGSISLTKQQKDIERVDKFLTQYKELSLPEVRVINDSRKKAILHILNKFTEEQVLTVLKNFSKSDFLLGKCSSFKANIDWILKESNFIKILEGNYNNNYSSTSARADNAISETYTEEELEELKRIDEERRRNGLRTKF